MVGLTTMLCSMSIRSDTTELKWPSEFFENVHGGDHHHSALLPPWERYPYTQDL